MSSQEPINGRVETIERPRIAPTPGGPDWTREYGPGGSQLNQAPDEQQMDMILASAFGRAKGALMEAFDCADAAERQRRVDRVILKLVRFALEGADARTILTGLL